MVIAVGNVFANLPAGEPDERIDDLALTRTCRIERIVSHGHASPPGFWYDQDQAEWVIVLSGSARLQIAGEDGPRHMGPGDYVFLPAHVRHRVEATDMNEPTIWLAVRDR